MKIKKTVNSSDALAQQVAKLKRIRQEQEEARQRREQEQLLANKEIQATNERHEKRLHQYDPVEMNEVVTRIEDTIVDTPVEAPKELSALEKLRARLADQNSDKEPENASEELVEVAEDVELSDSVEEVSEDIEEVVEPVVEDTSEPVVEVDTVYTETLIQDLSDVEEDNIDDDNIDYDIEDLEDDVIDEKPVWYKRKGAIIGAVVALLLVLIGVTTVVTINMMHKKPAITKTTKTKTSSSSSKVVDPVEQLTENLKAEAKKSGIDNNVEVSQIGGGYLLGAVTYYPNDATKSYVDYSITKPEKTSELVSDETSEKIEKALKEKLPTINDTLKIKDKSKLTMETYKLDDATYSTVLLYDKKPFAYVTSDTDLNMVNHATTYYVKDVAA
jgi:hypothetical protein